MKLNTFKYARQDEHKLSHLEIPLIMSPSEDGRKWSVSLLLGFLPLLIIPFLICFFSHFTFLCSCSWANIPSKTSLFTAALNLSLSFLFMKMDLSFPPVASFYCVGSVSLSCLLLTWNRQSPVGSNRLTTFSGNHLLILSLFWGSNSVYCS